MFHFAFMYNIPLPTKWCATTTAYYAHSFYVSEIQKGYTQELLACGQQSLMP